MAVTTTEIKTSPVVINEETHNLPPTAPPPGVQVRTLPAAWDRIIRGILCALTFLLPILFTTWTTEPLEFSKQMLLFVLISLALGAWLLKLLILRNWNFAKTPLDLPILIFVVVYLLAAIFSVDRVASFLGFYGNFHGNFFQILFLILFYYLVVNNFRSLGQLRRLLAVFVFSSFLALFYVALQFFKLFLFRFPLTKLPSFNTIGGLLMISLFAAFAILLSLGFKEKSWFSVYGGKLWRIVAIAVGFLVLLTVNFVYAWASLLVGVLCYMIFRVGTAKGFVLKDILAPLVLLIIVIAFLVSQWVFHAAPFRTLFNFDLPLEVRLDYKTAWPVLTGSVADKPIFGFGPNTFLYAFSKHKGPDFNLSPFWNVRFDKAPSEAAEYLSGSGVLGFLAFEILAAIFLVYGLLFLMRNKDQEGWDLALTMFAAFAVLWFAHWVLFFNLVMTFGFWLMIGAFMALSRVMDGEKVKVSSFSFASSPRRTISIVSVVSTALVLIIVFVFFSFAVYAADVFYQKGIRAASSPESYNQAQSDFERSIRLNRFRPDYYLTYGEFLFLQINNELAKKDPNLALIQSWLTASITTSRSAVNLSPVNWTAWERLANLYTFARPLVAGVDKFILESLSKAIEQDQKNPILYVELGQVYRLAARKLDTSILGSGPDTDGDGVSDSQEQIIGSNPNDPDSNGNNVVDGVEVLGGLNPAGTGMLPDEFLRRYVKTDTEKLVKAEEAFRKAIALKDDYVAAHFQLALTLEQAQKSDDAIKVLQGILARFPANLELKFELGRMYFGTGKFDLAQRQFREIVSASPGNSNSRFSLALTYERLGQPKKALDEYQRLLEQNPDNSLIKAKIAEMENLLNPAPKKKR